MNEPTLVQFKHRLQRMLDRDSAAAPSHSELQQLIEPVRDAGLALDALRAAAGFLDASDPARRILLEDLCEWSMLPTPVTREVIEQFCDRQGDFSFLQSETGREQAYRVAS